MIHLSKIKKIKKKSYSFQYDYSVPFGQDAYSRDKKKKKKSKMFDTIKVFQMSMIHPSRTKIQCITLKISKGIYHIKNIFSLGMCPFIKNKEISMRGPKCLLVVVQNKKVTKESLNHL